MWLLVPSSVADPGSGDLYHQDPGFIFHPSFMNSRMKTFGIRNEKFRDPDPVSGIKHPGSATLVPSPNLICKRKPSL
jgi:hypothetical protein